MVDDDGSFVVAGYTSGAFDGVSAGSYDFIAIKLDTYGHELWRWQVGGKGVSFRLQEVRVRPFNPFARTSGTGVARAFLLQSRTSN